MHVSHSFAGECEARVHGSGRRLVGDSSHVQVQVSGASRVLPAPLMPDQRALALERRFKVQTSRTSEVFYLVHIVHNFLVRMRFFQCVNHFGHERALLNAHANFNTVLFNRLCPPGRAYSG